MIEVKNHSWLYKKGKVFSHRRWGTLVKITEYFPPTDKEPEKVSFIEINVIDNKPRTGECFGKISQFLYDIDYEIECIDKMLYENSKKDLTNE